LQLWKALPIDWSSPKTSPSRSSNSRNDCLRRNHIQQHYEAQAYAHELPAPYWKKFAELFVFVRLSRRRKKTRSAVEAFTSIHHHVRHQPDHEDRQVWFTGRNSRHKTILIRCRSLYRRSLKLALDWAVQRNLWRGQAVYIRSLFDANKNIRDPRQQRVRSKRNI
jgi:hypothetical protein